MSKQNSGNSSAIESEESSPETATPFFSIISDLFSVSELSFLTSFLVINAIP